MRDRGILIILTIMLAVLKYSGVPPVSGWSWWDVGVPLYLWVFISVVYMAVCIVSNNKL